MKPRICPSKQQGAAIIVALFIMSLVAAAAIAMMVRAHVNIRRTTLLLNANQATALASGSEAWAIDTLTTNAKQKNPQAIDQMPIHSTVKTAEGFFIDSTIEDMQGYFNLNNLTLIDYQDNFIRLLQTVAPKLDAPSAHQIMLSISDWISPVIKNSGEDNYYSELHPPYRSPHRLMASVSELRLVKGITSQIFASLSPFITALPEPTAININAVSAPVLMSLSPTLSAESAAEIILQRTHAPFLTADQFLNLATVKNNKIPAEKIITRSRYFLLKTNVTVDAQRIVLYTLLVRNMQNNKPTINVIWQTKGTL